MSAPLPPSHDDSTAPSGGNASNPLLKSIVRHSYDRPRLPWLRFGASVAAAALLGVGIGVGVAGLFTATAPEETVAASAADNILAVPGSEDVVGEEDSGEAADPAVEPLEETAAAPGPNRETVTVEQGDTLMSILIEAGLSRTEAFGAIEALKPLFNPRDLRVDQEVTITLTPAESGSDAEVDGDAPRLVELAFDTDVDRRVVLSRAEAGTLSAREERTELTVALARVTGTIDDSLFAAASRAGIPATVTTELIRMFSYDVDFQRDIHPGDQFELLVERHQDPDGRTLKWGDILYAKLTTTDETLPIYRFTPADDGIPDFFNPKGESVRKALLRTPIDGARISSGFGMRRHPILGYSKMHKGLDFAAPTGTPILAAGDGVIDKIGRAGAYGNYVRLRHDGKYSTAYAHMSRFARGLKPGSRVRQGQTIGYVGTTGRSTGPHLHYEILTAGKQINPRVSVSNPGGAWRARNCARLPHASARSTPCWRPPPCWPPWPIRSGPRPKHRRNKAQSPGSMPGD
ncbi:M23 family peptidase [Oleomonas cavernae]|uniref:M23 family peptidase n=1 Tax=Oleomonas cavernae TaxID=2320859 RepID=A0A418W8H2_9PROT|nr:peptidoglycan DD-metalloendopeptidase family protein [Oleomonas cavernae]RJF86310.1 M23 family peptidase [Oleomonas cavernae]